MPKKTTDRFRTYERDESLFVNLMSLNSLGQTTYRVTGSNLIPDSNLCSTLVRLSLDVRWICAKGKINVY